MRRAPVLLASVLLVAACGTKPEETASDAGSAGDAATQVLRPDASEESLRNPCDLVAPGIADLTNYAQLELCLHTAVPESTQRDAIGRFVASVQEGGDGFPLVGNGKVVFVYVRQAQYDDAPEAPFEEAKRGEPIRVAGEFNNWSPNQVLENDGLGFYSAVVTMQPKADTRVAYKLVSKSGGQDFYFADPLARRFQYDGNGRLSYIRGGDKSGHLERLRNVHATKLNVDRDIYVWLPRNYDWSGTTRYPVLYMHDGNNLFDTGQPSSAPASWEADAVADAEIGAENVSEFIIVGVPNNVNRFGEYTHTQDDIGDGKPVGGDGDAYGDFLVKDLKPLIDKRYRTLADKDHTGLLGSSLGGLISFYVGLKHPETFKYVGGMSSTFDWGTIGLTNPTMIDLYKGTANLSAQGQVYYLDSGGNAPKTGSCPGADGDNYCATQEMKDTLVAAGIGPFPDDPNAVPLTPANVRIYHWFQPGAQHNEVEWNKRLFRPLRLFFRK